MELSKTSDRKILSRVGSRAVKWTNRYECPPGYTFNEEGWVETFSTFPKISVVMLPYLLNKLGEKQLLLQNLLALRLLNDKPHEELCEVLKFRFKQAFFGRRVDKEVFDVVVEESLSITNTGHLPEICSDILRFDTIWFSVDSAFKSKTQIKQRIRNNYIAAVRDLMPINKKYNTKEVMLETESTKYAINTYWKSAGLDAKIRSITAVSEAYNELMDTGEEPDQKLLALVSGVSVRSIQRYKDMWTLPQ